MKKPFRPTPNAVLRAEAKRAERSRRGKAKRHDKADATPLPEQSRFQSSHERTVIRGLPRGYLDLEVPAILDFSTEYENTVAFIQEIPRLIFGSRKRVRLIFDETEEIRPAPLLMLAAHVSRCRQWMGESALTGTYPRSAKLEKMLEDTGFFRLLGVGHRNSRAPAKFPLDYIPHMAGTRCEGSDVEKLQEKIFGDTTKLDALAKAKLYRGVTEAMTNVIHHAYPAGETGRYPVTRNQWWMSGHINRLRKELVIVIFDLGVTIPRTLPLRYPSELIHSILGTLGFIEPVDGALIKAAMEIGRTSVVGESQHRGKGLRQMGEIVEQCGGGTLRILSRKGDYVYHGVGSDKVVTNERALYGTLIEWRVPLEQYAAYVLQETEDA